MQIKLSNLATMGKIKNIFKPKMRPVGLVNINIRQTKLSGEEEDLK